MTNDTDLIRRGDAIKALGWGDIYGRNAQDAIRALPAAPDLSDPVTVHANMLRGSIAKLTLDQVVHLYGIDAICRHLAPMIVREDSAMVAAEREALFAALDPIIHDLKTAAAIGYTLVDFSTEETEHVDALTEVHTAYIDALQRYMKLRGKS